MIVYANVKINNYIKKYQKMKKYKAEFEMKFLVSGYRMWNDLF
jgi:hypothetical protein